MSTAGTFTICLVHVLAATYIQCTASQTQAEMCWVMQQQIMMGAQQQPAMGQGMPMQQPQVMQPQPVPEQAPVGLRPVQVTFPPGNA